MRAIANEQIDGFPKKDLLKTVFVEHEIQERQVGEDDHKYPIYNTDLSGIDWVLDYLNNVYGIYPNVSRQCVYEKMKKTGFGSSMENLERAANMDMPVTTYSGGWKMKMQLCAASLLDADILMLDEPTGHLDITNIVWLKDWLRTFLKGGGSIITTSHDSVFLTEMCTHIIDFQKKKLITFRGNLTSFVEKFPEKRGYFELKDDIVKFEFPQPGNLEGVKSLSKHILKMNHVYFTYPSRSKPTVTNISLECSRISRVAVIGPNGAGKSTAIKLLIGELKPSQGFIYKHPNLRLAYVAQHAFYHLEKHATRTPTQYIMWRFAGNEDKESIELLDKRSEDLAKSIHFYLDSSGLRECITPDDEKKKVIPEAILSKHESKKGKEYQVKWKDKSKEETTWVEREILIKMGATKLVQKFDEQEAVAGGLMNRPLTSKCIQEHFQKFGIEPEHASHTLIRSLSGGQKIKVVLAAALWQNPHLIILDEPTNYLDRDSLGALVIAIQNFQGGVIIISHNREFADAVCQEKWIMDCGNLRKEGESINHHHEENSSNHLIEDDIVLDSLGNEIRVEKKKTLSDKEKKIEIKRLQKLLNEAKKKKIRLTEDEIIDYELKIEELQNPSTNAQ
jgi:elongation factor 3